jgi:DNA polymerase I-like protein with 3'-5' exonuclease and polymerase domains
LIQGSAADQTKDSIIEYHKTGAPGRFLMTVHDENVTSSSIDDLKENVEALKHSMESLPGFDVPFVAEIEYGANWHDLAKYETH